MYSSLKKIQWISQLMNSTQFLFFTLSRSAARSRQELKYPLLMPKLQKTLFQPERMRTSALPKIRQQGSQTMPRMILVSLGSRLGQLYELLSLQTFLLSRETMRAYSSITEVTSACSCPEQQQAISALSVSTIRAMLEWPSMNWWKLVLWSRLYSQSLLVFSMSCFMWVSMESIRNFFSGFRFSRMSPMKRVLCQTKLAERNLPIMPAFPPFQSFCCKALARSFWSYNYLMSLFFVFFSSSSSFLDDSSYYSTFFFWSVASSSDRLASLNKSLVLLCCLTSILSYNSNSFCLFSALSALRLASLVFNFYSSSQASFSQSNRVNSFTLVFKYYTFLASCSCNLEDCSSEDQRVSLRLILSEVWSGYFFNYYS